MCYIVVAGQSLLQFKVRQTCFIVASFVHSLLVHCPAYMGAVSLPQIDSAGGSSGAPHTGGGMPDLAWARGFHPTLVATTQVVGGDKEAGNVLHNDEGKRQAT